MSVILWHQPREGTEEMTVSLEAAINSALDTARQSGVLMFYEATSRVMAASDGSDAGLEALIERRILNEARIRGVPVLFSHRPMPDIEPYQPDLFSL